MENKGLVLTKVDYFNFLKEAHYKEFDRRSALNTEIGMQITAVIALCSMSLLIFKELSKSQLIGNYLFHNLINICVLLNFIAVILTIFYFLNGYYKILGGGRSYSYLPQWDTMTESILYLQDEDSQFIDRLIVTFSDIVSNNRAQNDEKSQQITKSSKFLSCSAGLTTILSIFYIFNLFINMSNQQQNNEPIVRPETQSTPEVYPKPVEKVVPFEIQKLQERSDTTPFIKKN